MIPIYQNYKRKKQPTSDIPSLDIRQINGISTAIHRRGNLHIPNNEEPIEFTVGGDVLLLAASNQTIHFDITKCNYGGVRHWFKCPQCNRRTLKLFYQRNVFLCRQCHNLTYASQNQMEIDRLLWRLVKIRRSLGYQGIAEPILKKPKCMHWKTFESLYDEERELSYKYGSAAISYLGIKLSI